MTDPLAFLAGGGEAARMIRARDWSGHPLGPPETWPAEFRAALSLVLNSPESMILAWGPDLHFFFNDTYVPLLGPRLPWAMGARFDEVWADGWAQAKPIIDAAMDGRPERFTDLPWRLDSDRGARETWWTFSYSRVLDADGKVAGLFILTNETTGRVLSDAALTDSQARLETALAELRDLNASLARQVEERTADRNALWTLSSDMMLRCLFDGTITAVNPAWTEVLGWRADELVGTNLIDFVHPDDLGRTAEGGRQLAEGRSQARFDNRYRHRDGSYRWITWAARPGETVINAVGRDFTAERERADALAAAEEALRQSQKMEAVGQLTGGIAHDFNNLLAGISGSLELIQTRLAQGRLKDVDRYINAAQGASKRAAALTHRLLAFSRRQTLDPKPTDVNRLVAGLEELIRRTVGPAVTVDVIAATGLWPALVDPPQLENALLNLCINARDAMPEGGSIIIETANTALDAREARQRDMPPGPYLLLRVTDTGTGMAPEIVGKVFEPFFTTKPLGQGTGLGLSMIYGFAQQSGGQVRIVSELGRGTKVCLYLPRHGGTVAEEDPLAAAGAPARAAPGETVLVVDDEPTVRMLVTEVLEDLGYTAIEAADSVAGLKVLQSDVRIDLLVSDVGLPGGMNGRQMAEAGRSTRPGLKVLFITGYAEAAVLGNGQLDPGMQVITKPFVVEVLGARIREMIGTA
ncbi:hybrid sensor histidine kinase/response regulator [Methylobacterium brachiatum]|uniref:histidine kinase n=1 Tax=Methylobacterium brachiatum TaxID=269660 RepID=A0AAJ1WWD2_9HYPH|nr:PAS domain-containing sensor histidine kinase [Methylobacterium brachiatum]MCB4806035.1 PAS domain S-box protein [Methylobacterium brachiatum]MDH2314113.1 ATP-binding protein [Methylobacterium brachiatum]MDQ0543610.1 PAS domain S-box-containing protein [Methylobacterium brachiatum]